MTVISLSRVLKKSVELFGRGHVFSNVILGLGETDEEMEACILELTTLGSNSCYQAFKPDCRIRRFHAGRVLNGCSWLQDIMKKHYRLQDWTPGKP